MKTNRRIDPTPHYHAQVRAYLLQYAAAALNGSLEPMLIINAASALSDLRSFTEPSTLN
jgi:hypothetical protein